jgi:putative flippase GtrA
MTDQTMPAPSETSAHTLEMRDLFFAAINGLFIGILAPFIFRNLGAALPVSPALFAFVLTIVCVMGIAIGYFLSKISPRLGFFFQLAKFGLIGTANFVVDVGIFTLLTWATDISEGNALIFFNIISVSVAIINSYIWNKFWSFGEKNTDESVVRKQFFQFVTVSVIGLILNTLVVDILNNRIGSPVGIETEKWLVISKAIASVIVLIWNFIGYKFFVFKR